MFQRIRGEFREMPGLKLTIAQAARLFTCEKLGRGLTPP